MDHPEGPPGPGVAGRPASTSRAAATGVVVDLTSELRWFFDGRLPDDVHAWFTHDGTTGLSETRRDTYRLDGEVDIGVKHRYETILELKLRQGPPQAFRRRDLDGRLEVWRRWSPADGMIFLGANAHWVDVDKTVIKRRFAPDGAEVALTHETRAMTGAGCDAEVADVTVRGRPAWTVALAAFGPADDHVASLTAAWAGLVTPRSLPRRLPLPWSNSFGYPEWMAQHFHDGEPSVREVVRPPRPTTPGRSDVP